MSAVLLGGARLPDLPVPATAPAKTAAPPDAKKPGPEKPTPTPVGAIDTHKVGPIESRTVTINGTPYLVKGREVDGEFLMRNGP